MQLKFYYCKTCGKIISIVKDSGTPTICCGNEMQLLVPEAQTEIGEKHIPIIKVSGNLVTVTVGSKIHPSEAEHYIEWILLQTDRGIQQKYLAPGISPEIDFAVMTGERVQAAYDYCNIHKLWKSEFSSEKSA